MSRAVIHKQLDALKVYTGERSNLSLKRKIRRAAATKRLHERVIASAQHKTSRKPTKQSRHKHRRLPAVSSEDIGSWSSDEEEEHKEENSHEEKAAGVASGQQREGAQETDAGRDAALQTLPYALENRRVREFKRRERRRDRTRRNVRALSQLDRIAKPSRKASLAMSLLLDSRAPPRRDTKAAKRKKAKKEGKKFCILDVPI